MLWKGRFGGSQKLSLLKKCCMSWRRLYRYLMSHVKGQHLYRKEHGPAAISHQGPPLSQESLKCNRMEKQDATCRLEIRSLQVVAERLESGSHWE